MFGRAPHVTHLTEALGSGQLDILRFIRKIAYVLYEPAETPPPLDLERVENEEALPVNPVDWDEDS